MTIFFAVIAGMGFTLFIWGAWSAMSLLSRLWDDGRGWKGRNGKRNSNDH